MKEVPHCHVHHVCVGHTKPYQTWTLPCTCRVGMPEEAGR